MDDSFIDLISKLENLNYEALWKLILLGMIRFAPIVTITPFLGAKLIPTIARVALALSLTVVFLPTILYHSQTPIDSTAAFIGYSVKELFIGFILGYIISIPFFIAQSSGIFIDYMRGSSMLMAQDPSTQTQASPIGIMLNYYLIVLFYGLDGPLIFFDVMQTTFQVVPVDAFIAPSFFQLNDSFWQIALGLLNQLFTLSLQLAAPSLLAILMAEMFLGIANRLAPQVQIAFLGMPLKSLLGLTLLWTGWYFIIQKMSVMSIDYIELIQKVVHQAFPHINKIS